MKITEQRRLDDEECVEFVRRFEKSFPGLVRWREMYEVTSDAATAATEVHVDDAGSTG